MALYPLSKILWRFLTVFMVAICLICAFVVYERKFQTTALSGTDSPNHSALHSEDVDECPSVCNSRDCVYFAQEIMRNMNPKADPCENFYSFACEGLEEKLGKYEAFDVFSNQDDILMYALKDIIENSDDPEGSVNEKLKTVYESCINEESSEMNSVETLLQFLNEIGIPNWPNLNSDFTFKEPSLEDVLGTLISYQEKVFFEIQQPPFDECKKGMTIPIDSPYDEKTLNEDDMEKVMYEIFQQLNVEVSNKSVVMEDFIRIETGIQTLMKNNSKIKRNSGLGFRNYSFVNCTAERSHDEAFLCSVFKSFLRSSRVESFINSDGYNLDQREHFYFENVIPFLDGFSHRALANYIALKVVMHNTEYLTFNLRRYTEYYFFNGYVSERHFELDKYKFCIQFLKNHMPYNLALMTASEFFPGDTVDEVNQIFKEITATTANIASQQDWIDDSMKEQILNETEKYRNLFYEDVSQLNETLLSMLYQKFEFNPSKGNFFRNVLDCKRIFLTAQFSLIYNYELMYMEFELQASYYGGLGIGIGLAGLMPPFYKSGMNKFFGYLSLGQLIGHETGHFFDDSLRELAKENETIAAVEERHTCLKEQYSKFLIEDIGKYVKGEKTTENYADNFGLIAIEKMIKDYRTNTTKNFYLPGLPYSTEKLFYIINSQLWCTILPKDDLDYRYEHDSHTLPNFRVLGMLQNSKKFSQVFNCKPNSFMNPDKKCTVVNV